MSALSIQPTYPIFTDIDGQPLENGYIWIGTANLDPQTNPLTIYWDGALTQPAVQPIRTLGGYPMNNGTPARFYANADYSIRVINKNGSTIYTSLSGNVFGLGGGSQVITATAGQTVFNAVGAFVFVNGSKQIATLNYTQSGATTTFLTGLNVGDVVEFI